MNYKTLVMKILIINQHSMNHGDEAGKALIRTLYDRGFQDIAVSYNMNDFDASCLFKYKNVKQILPTKKKARGLDKITKLYLKCPCFITRFLTLMYLQRRREVKMIKEANIVISAPGGVNMGLYRDYGYVWRLKEVLYQGKSLVIYSPSIGPFTTNDFFRKIAKEILTRSTFVSLRDTQSYRYAEDLSAHYIQSIDTAYLETPRMDLPLELLNLLPKEYVVLVPNELYSWHIDYFHYDKRSIDCFYSSLIDKFTSNGLTVVLLPQLFYQPNMEDEDYFNRLKAENEKVIVIPTYYDSDIQQAIIKRAQFVVGARYHTIVFSINNETPFVCLSYEHKMKNMLEILSLDSYSIDISYAFENHKIVIDKIWEMYLDRVSVLNVLYDGKKKAKLLARKTFDFLIKKLRSM